MTTYTDLDSALTSGSIFTATQAQALRDNPKAIVEGNAAGATPPIQVLTPAIATGAVTTGEGEKLEPARQSNVDATTDSAFTGFAVGYMRIDGSRSASNTYDTNSGTIKILRAGEYCIRIAWSGTGGSYNARCQIFINGVSVYLSNPTTSTTLYYKHVVTLAAGDTVRVRSVSGDGSANGGNSALSCLILCDNPLLDAQPTTYLQTTYSSSVSSSTGVAYWVGS